MYIKEFINSVPFFNHPVVNIFVIALFLWVNFESRYNSKIKNLTKIYYLELLSLIVIYSLLVLTLIFTSHLPLSNFLKLFFLYFKYFFTISFIIIACSILVLKYRTEHDF